MNKLFLGLVIMLLPFIVSAQQPVKSGAISFVLPRGSADVTNIKSLKSDSTVNKHSLILGDDMRKMGKIYRIENVLLFVNSGDGNTKKDHLESRRDNYLYMSRLNSGIKITVGEIKSLNNYDYLEVVNEYENDPKLYIIFYAVDKAHTKTLIGSAEYLKKDRQKGEQVLNDFLKNMKFE